MEEIKKEKKEAIVSKVLSGIKMKSAGKKQGNYDGPCSVSSSDEIMYPSLYLDAKQAPGLTEYEVGDKVMMIIEGEVVSHSADESMKSKRESFNVSIKKLGVKPKIEEE